MFRKTFARKGTKRPRLETRAHAARAFKRVTRQWELGMNVKCQIVAADELADCPNGGKIIVMSQAQLQGSAGFPGNPNFPDAVRIRRISGNLYFRPTQIIAPSSSDPVSDCLGTAFFNSKTIYMRAGLRKLPGPQNQAGTPDALNPLNNGATAAEVSDYADGRWMKMWEHVWDPASDISSGIDNNFSCCTSQASYAVPPTASGSQAGYTVPAAVCQPCGDVENPAVNLSCVTNIKLPRWWHMRFNYGRTIVMKEADDLGLYFGWERLMERTDVARPEQPKMEFFGGFRLLLES